MFDIKIWKLVIRSFYERSDRAERVIGIVDLGETVKTRGNGERTFLWRKTNIPFSANSFTISLFLSSKVFFFIFCMLTQYGGDPKLFTCILTFSLGLWREFCQPSYDGILVRIFLLYGTLKGGEHFYKRFWDFGFRISDFLKGWTMSFLLSVAMFSEPGLLRRILEISSSIAADYFYWWTRFGLYHFVL